MEIGGGLDVISGMHRGGMRFEDRGGGGEGVWRDVESSRLLKDRSIEAIAGYVAVNK